MNVDNVIQNEFNRVVDFMYKNHPFMDYMVVYLGNKNYVAFSTN